VKTRKKLPHANRIVDIPDGYFVVYESERRPFLKTNPETEWSVEWAAVLVGADLLRRL
jgi:hypothetical protein